jgi:hypothetical protein
MVEKRKTEVVLVVKAEEKRPLGRPRYKWDWKIWTELIRLRTGTRSMLMLT